MYSSTTASLICPACGQAFLCMQHAMDGVAQCPHCAHSAPRAQFGTQAQVAGISPGKRRVAHVPVLGEAAMGMPPQASPVSFPSGAPEAPPYGAAPTWATPPSAAEPSGAHASVVMRPYQLQASAALIPVNAPPPPRQEGEWEARGHRSRSGRGWRLLLVLGALGGVAAWVWHAQHPLETLPVTEVPAQTLPSPGAVEVRKAELPSAETAPAAKVVVKRDVDAYAADAKALVTAFFAATTAEQRAECVHDGGAFSAEIEAIFGPAAPAKVELRQLAVIPTTTLTLPGGEHEPLFKMVTSACPGGALLRLEESPDGKRRLFWPMLAESHEGKLAAYLKEGGEQEAWFYVAMRPSHGLELPAEVRGKHVVFDAQTTASNDQHFLACVEKETPLGRLLDRESDWGRVYVARLLVRRLVVEADSPALLIVGCEGAGEG